MADGPLSVKVIKKSLDKITNDVQRAAHGEAMRGVRRVISRETLYARKRIRAAALGTLPHKGGLNRWAAVMPIAVVRENRSGVTAKIRMAKGRHDMKDLDRGRIRHPLFGNRKHWYEETFPSGFFSKEIERMKPELEARIAEALHQFAEQFNGKGFQ